jgi:hypothetical protein
MKAKTRREDRHVALKLDISQAYDRMDWNYLRAVLNKMGFHNRWIHWSLFTLIYVGGLMP